MRGMIGYCGLDCEACDAYLATIHDDQALREKQRRFGPSSIKRRSCRSTSIAKAAVWMV